MPKIAAEALYDGFRSYLTTWASKITKIGIVIMDEPTYEAFVVALKDSEFSNKPASVLSREIFEE